MDYLNQGIIIIIPRQAEYQYQQHQQRIKVKKFSSRLGGV